MVRMCWAFAMGHVNDCLLKTIAAHLNDKFLSKYTTHTTYLDPCDPYIVKPIFNVVLDFANGLGVGTVNAMHDGKRVNANENFMISSSERK
jgi:hypothetical protein